MPQKLTAEIINAAIAGFEQQKTRIDQQIADLRAILPGGRTATAITVNGALRKRRTMSAAGRKRIALAQKARWAKIHGESVSAPAEQPKPKRRLSAAGRRKIIAAAKKRWALKRAAGAVAKRAARKKASAKKAALKASAVNAA